MVQKSIRPGNLILPIQKSGNNPSWTRHGDMILSGKQKKSLFKSTKLRSGVKNPSQLWPQGLVYFEFSPNISKFT